MRSCPATPGQWAGMRRPPRWASAVRWLVQAVEADCGGRTRAALHGAARQLGADLGRRHRADGARDDGQWPALESALSEHGFEPRHDDAGTVRMRNCPFRRLAELQ